MAAFGAGLLDDPLSASDWDTDSLLAGADCAGASVGAPQAEQSQSVARLMIKKFVKQFVEWMHVKIGADALLDLATHSEPARVEEYKARIMKWPVDADGAMVEDETAVKADHDAAKREALTGIGHCIFS